MFRFLRATGILNSACSEPHARPHLRTQRRSSPIAWVICGLSAVSLMSCEAASDPMASSLDEAIHHVIVTPTSAQLKGLSGSEQLYATAYNEYGDEITGVTFDWSSSDPSLASVSSNGKVNGKGKGKTRITARAGGKADSATVEVDEPESDPKEGTAGPASVRISPESVTIYGIGKKMQLTAEALDSAGNVVDGATFTWASAVPEIVTVSEGGVVESKMLGTILIAATVACGTSACSEGLEGDASPGYASVAVMAERSNNDGAIPLHSEDFSDFSSVSDYMASLPHGGWPKNLSRMDFVADGSPGGSGQSIRFTYPDATDIGGEGREGRCYGNAIGFDYDIRPLVDAVPQKEIWAEYWVKYSDNWTTAPPAEWNCTGTPEHKLVFGHVFGGTGRFGVNQGNNVHAWSISAPSEPWWHKRLGDSSQVVGKWFRLRTHMRVSSEEGAEDGVFRVWLDDELIADSGPQVINRTRIWGLGLGRNRNHQAGEPMSVSFGGFSIWNQNPGW